MEVAEILIIGIGLAMDAFAVSICKGLSMKKLDLKKMIIIGLYFGVFQALMPIIGFILGKGFEDIVVSIDHWIAFGLLSVIGINMIRDVFSEEDSQNDDVSFKTMIMLGVATSIDALAVGVTFAFLHVNIVFSVATIGVITFIISAIGVVIGNKFGNKFENKAKLFGGVVLILMGVKILIEHLFWG